ncbi:phenylacetic acid degradation protein [Leucobacter exalbidus]|uniref:Phenylacetic acid degradation protein n=1 Tax=Leucobacter exalbidus TaxID=662960 RepID=A0A940PSJ9_9MICO|nr:gamma carbonic anhydrase family protein [Leucobacter exalbidus]MBP1325992.1 phenylacetic acid degradation protein [Leucobacter exalbidus]
MPCYEIDGIVPVVHPTSFVHDSASLIGDVIIGPNCYIGPFASLRGDFGRIIVGEGSNVQDAVVIHAFPGADAVLAPNSHIGHAAVLHGCHIGSYALVGIGAIVLDGATIGAGALVGAGSLVTAGTEIPERVLALGSPARVIRVLDDTALAWKEQGVHVYQELTARSRATLRQVDPLPEAEKERGRVSTDATTSQPLHTHARPN